MKLHCLGRTHVCEPDGEALSFDSSWEEIPGFGTSGGDWMPATSELCGVPGRLSGTDGGEATECGGGAMGSGSGTSKGFPIVNNSWGSTELRGVGFMVYTFWTMLITIVGRLPNISFMESPVIFMNFLCESTISL